MNQRLEKIKTHLQENKKVYIGTAIGVVAGAVGVLLFKHNDEVTQIVNTVAPVFNNNNSSNVSLGGYSHKLVKCNETNEIWETVTGAAKAAGVEVSKMSRHLNGHMPHVNDATYSIIGVGTSS